MNWSNLQTFAYFKTQLLQQNPKHNKQFKNVKLFQICYLTCYHITMQTLTIKISTYIAIDMWVLGMR